MSSGAAAPVRNMGVAPAVKWGGGKVLSSTRLRSNICAKGTDVTAQKACATDTSSRFGVDLTDSIGI